MLIFTDLNQVVHIINPKSISNILIHDSKIYHRITMHFHHNHVLTAQISEDVADYIKQALEQTGANQSD